MYDSVRRECDWKCKCDKAVHSQGLLLVLRLYLRWPDKHAPSRYWGPRLQIPRGARLFGSLNGVYVFSNCFHLAVRANLGLTYADRCVIFSDCLHLGLRRIFGFWPKKKCGVCIPKNALILGVLAHGGHSFGKPIKSRKPTMTPPPFLITVQLRDKKGCGFRPHGCALILGP